LGSQLREYDSAMKVTRIETARLWLRPLTRDDGEAMYRLWIDPDVRRYLWDDQVIAKEQAASIVDDSVKLFTAQGYGLWAILPRGEETFIGFCGYWFFHDPPELQLLYGMAPTYWGKGLTTEAARAMLRYGFAELGLERIVGSTDVPNVASARVMEKAGMTYEKRTRIHDLDTVYYMITRESFIPDDSFYRVEREGESRKLFQSAG
jgi:ribosomal-protein-alanine N-acetyltransferase